MSESNCDDCKFYKHHDGVNAEGMECGYCKRFPPVFVGPMEPVDEWSGDIPYEKFTKWSHPVVMGCAEWCGEFLRK